MPPHFSQKDTLVLAPCQSSRPLPRVTTRATVWSEVRKTKSASAPGANTPLALSRPILFAGLKVAICTASRSGTPRDTICLSARPSVSVLPALLNAHASLGVSGIGVTECDRDSRLLGRFDDLLCSRQLRRQRQNARAAICRRHEAIEYRDRRLRQRRRRMHSSPGRADKW